MTIEQAVILAGGLGTRMRPMTEQVPKPLLPVNGKPFLQHQIQLLRSHGLQRFLLLVGYLGEQIEQYFGDGAAMGAHIAYSYESSPLGTAGALKNAEGKLDPEFVVLNGDTYLDVDYQAVFATFIDCKCHGLTVAFDNPEQLLKNNLGLDAEGTVIAYSKAGGTTPLASGPTHLPSGLTHVDAGATVLRREVLDLIPPGRKCSLEEDIFPVLIRNQQLKAWPTRERFIDMGSTRGLAALQEKLG